MQSPGLVIHEMPDSIVYSITDTIAGEKDVEAVDLPPLQDVIDIDALKGFVQSTEETATLKFEYHQWEVTVHGDGSVEMTKVRQ